MIAFAGPNVFTLAPLLAVRPEGTPVKIPEIRTQRDGERMRFTPDGRGLVFMRAEEATLAGFLAAGSQDDEYAEADAPDGSRHHAHV
jgi:hypothetical protein